MSYCAYVWFENVRCVFKMSNDLSDTKLHPFLCLISLFCPPTVIERLFHFYFILILSLGLQGLHGKCARSSCTVVLFFCLDSMCSGSTAQFLLCPGPHGTQVVGRYAILTSLVFSSSPSHPAQNKWAALGLSVHTWHSHSRPRSLECPAV